MIIRLEHWHSLEEENFANPSALPALQAIPSIRPYPDSGVGVAVSHAELMPGGLEILQRDSGGRRSRNAAEVDCDLAEKLVGAEAVIVPNGDFEDTVEEVRGTNPRVNERLAPDGIACVDHSLSAPLRPLTAAPRVRSGGKGICNSLVIMHVIGCGSIRSRQSVQTQGKLVRNGESFLISS